MRNIKRLPKKCLIALAFLLSLSSACVGAGRPMALVLQKHGVQAPDWVEVKTEFYRLINELRAQRRLTLLSPDDAALDSAAFDQARYMLKRKQVTHDQNSRKKATPFKRVQLYGGHFNIVGENCILIFIDTPMAVKKNGKTVVVSTNKEIAAALFAGWKASPKHYKNMLTKEYQLSGLGFAYDQESGQFYSAEVFGGNFSR